MIREATAKDAERIARIYNHYVRETAVTFEEEEVSAAEMEERITSLRKEGLPWFVLEEGGVLLGYAYGSRWKSRCAYRYSAESTVYLSHEHLGRGGGRLLYARLIEELRARGYRSMIGGIALPNEKSRNLHEYFRFKNVARFEKVGYKFGRWIDVGYWQLDLMADHSSPS